MTTKTETYEKELTENKLSFKTYLELESITLASAPQVRQFQIRPFKWFLCKVQHYVNYLLQGNK